MTKKIKKLIYILAEKQKTIFLIDSLGAILTSFFLFVIMRQFNEYFGMPETILTSLSILAICFSIYSMACFLFLKGSPTPFIRIIGIANLLYCSLTILLLIKHFALLTIIGTIYFLIEIVIILGLSYIELHVARELKKKNSLNN